MRPPESQIWLEQLDNEIEVDNFAGGGGASTGLEMALGRSPAIAINHDPEALGMHRINHPQTEHHCEDVYQIDPHVVLRGRRVGLAWFSPDCKHFSKAKGGKPCSKRVRGLAWVVIRWAHAVQPRVIMLENVEEFLDWGPLDRDTMLPIKDRLGETFKAWRRKLEKLGYVVEYRELRACDYGAPTTRKRLFVIARRDGRPIVWPEPTHGPGRPLPHRIAGECIEWSVPARSIFGRERPLAEATMRRIARGTFRYAIECPDPFIVPGTGAPAALAVPTLIQTSWGERPGQAPRVPGLEKPIGTLMAQGVKHALVCAFLAKHYGGNEGPGTSLIRPFATFTTQDHHALVTSHISKLYGTSTGAPLTTPMPTVTAGGNHLAEVRAFLIKYYGTSRDGQALSEPIDTLTTKPRFGLVTVAGEDYTIADIGMRMLIPRELYRGQGFPESYIIDRLDDGQILTATSQVRMAGNSVCPPLAAALVRANYGKAADLNWRASQSLELRSAGAA